MSKNFVNLLSACACVSALFGMFNLIGYMSDDDKIEKQTISIRTNDSLRNVIKQKDAEIAHFKAVKRNQDSYNSSVFAICIQNGLYGESTLQFFNGGIDTFTPLGLECALSLKNTVTIRTDECYGLGERLRLVHDN